jgi:hypothetical protein
MKTYYCSKGLEGKEYKGNFIKAEGHEEAAKVMLKGNVKKCEKAHSFEECTIVHEINTQYPNNKKILFKKE